ncbi:hypothetical protein PC110_g17275 [Phytophthora cactorum]|uniref:Bifunctional dihydrofolate reductase-thymidylate synthase n=2 Tax=Phytophthora cactorum TaxID=29920 RepID=A0A329RQ33_9STRA|nr:hypothetical protein PC110_g17275 [Phytophthora cactorum]
MAQRRLPVSLIVACSVNRVIGKQGKLPWNLPADWAFFSSTTQSQVLVVGRRSFEEFDEPIPNRHTIVVSSTLQRPEIEAAGRRWSGIQVVRTLEQALQLANTDPQYRNCNRVFISGGERLYKEAMDAKVAESCYVSRVQQQIADGDTFFPKWTKQFPNLMYSAKTNGGGSTRVSFEIWADQVPAGFNPDALAIIDYESGATADPTSSEWTTEVAIGEFDYNPAVPVVLPTTPDQRIIVEFTLGVLAPNPTAFLGYISLDGGDFSSLVIPDSPPLFTIAQGAKTEDLPTTANAIKLKHNDHVEVVVVNETPDQHPFHLHAHSPWIVGSGRTSRDNILAGNVTALRLNGPMQHDVFTVPECTTDADGACTDLGYVVFRLNADNPGVWLMHCHIDWHFVLGLAMLFVEAEDVLRDEGLGAFSNNMLLSVCNGNFTL